MEYPRMNNELKKEIEKLQEDTKAAINQFSICCELLMSRFNDIDRCQEYLFHEVKKMREKKCTNTK
jgi:hypothetical protein